MENETITIDRQTLRTLISTARAMAALESLNHDGPADSMEQAYASNSAECDKTRAWWLKHARSAIAAAEEVENA